MKPPNKWSDKRKIVAQFRNMEGVLQQVVAVGIGLEQVGIVTIYLDSVDPEEGARIILVGIPVIITVD